MPKIKKRESYRWTVKHIIAQRAGKPDFLEFDVEFRALPATKVNDLIGLCIKGEMPADDFISETMVGWHDMQRDGETEPWLFSVEAMKELCELYPGLPAALSKAWTESVTGGATRKN